MDVLLPIVAVIGMIAIVVGVPLSILRSLDELKAGQRRIESRLAELEERLTERERVG